MAYDEALAERIRELMPEGVDYTEKKMFGGLAFLVDGNMSISASGQGDMLVRFDPERTDEFLAEPHTNPFVMRERAMDGWLRVNPEGFASETDLARWITRGVGYARALPPK